MTKLEAALVEVASLLQELSIPYILIGGLAVSMWGEARATLDADFSLWVEPEDLPEIVRRISARLKAIPSDPVSFASASRVLPVNASNGIRADLVFASLPAEQKMIGRAQPKTVREATIMVASVEDLIWMKLMSERQKDIEDARRLIRRHARSLDKGYLEPMLREISEALARGDILEIYNLELERHP